jgi:hypothetical protein
MFVNKAVMMNFQVSPRRLKEASEPYQEPVFHPRFELEPHATLCRTCSHSLSFFSPQILAFTPRAVRVVLWCTERNGAGISPEYLSLRSRGSSVSKVSDYGLDDRGSITGRGRVFFL